MYISLPDSRLVVRKDVPETATPWRFSYVRDPRCVSRRTFGLADARVPHGCVGLKKDALPFPTEADAARTIARLRPSGPVTIEPIP